MFPSSMQKALSIYSHIEWMMKNGAPAFKIRSYIAHHLSIIYKNGKKCGVNSVLRKK